ncbi:plasmid replication protein RepC [Rhizobium wenxiniae]|uniref:plasmid replication protein RepC n=1 Tax=Rhizobium wenxiniae TaxID=1737357 RepID=UPI003C210C3F
MNLVFFPPTVNIKRRFCERYRFDRIPEKKEIRMHPVATFRKVTPGVMASAALAVREHAPHVDKTDVARVLKRVRSQLGIRGVAFEVLDMLLAISKPEDWQPGRRPVVSVSNYRAAFELGVSEKTITRALRQLVEAGIIAYRDSPTGRRYKNDDGDAYGLDFTPSQHRYAELKAIVDAKDNTYREERSTHRETGRISRQIVDTLTHLRAAGHKTSAFDEHFNALMPDYHARRRDADFLEELTNLLIDILQHFETGDSEDQPVDRAYDESSNMSATGDISDPQYTNTTPPSYVEKQRNRANARSHQNPDASYAGTLAYENKPARAGPKAQGLSRHENPDEIAYLLRKACSQLRADYMIAAGSWAELAPRIDELRALVGIPPETWTAGVKVGGRFHAAAALAIVAEKVIRAAGGLEGGTEIRRPAKYFLSMLYRSETGELNLLPTLRVLARSAMN